jgi:undecaprenyl-diphosphatase
MVAVMVSLVDVFILAVIQGLTEWLPISSSGHLVIAQKILGLNLPLILDVILHAGTAVVILVVFRKDVTDIIRALVKRDFESEGGKLALYISVGSVPIAFVGYFLHDFLESLFNNLLAIGLALLFTGFILFFSEKRQGNRRLCILDSLLVGLAQAVAIIPGVSRSGLTIATGLLRKIDKTAAFKFSFLLSVPAVIGAIVLESRDLVVSNIDIIPLFVGAIISLIVGFFSLKILQKIVMREKFHLFCYYCWTLGSVLTLFIIFQ